MQTFKGLPASEGIALGPVYVYRPVKISITAHPVESVDAEMRRFHAAVDCARQQLSSAQHAAEASIGAEAGAILEAQTLFLEDPALLDTVEEFIRRGQSAEAALDAGVEQFSATLAAMDDAYLRERASDVRDVGQRVLRVLASVDEPPLAALAQPVILVAENLTPSDTARMNKAMVLGICTAEGGLTSHTAILARLLGIPAVVGAGSAALAVPDGSALILDGTTGEVVVAPDAATQAVYQTRQAQWLAGRAQSLSSAQSPAVTRDGVSCEVVANIGDAESAQLALADGAEGVGLLRTEFLFLNRSQMPDEDEQYHAYSAVAEVMGTRPVVIRTLDIGGDKPLPYLDLGAEDNPFLGWRAIRISLEKPELFKTQLRAILRAGAGHNLKIMLPMIATLSEIVKARALLGEAQAELQSRNSLCAHSVELGIMIEIPSAALMADLLAPAVDFFSIGTNDLTQYTLACDRTNAHVADLFDHLHPAVLRLIRMVIEAAHRHGKWVGLCGEMAGDMEAIPILLGLGLDEFSMNPSSIPAAKHLIRRLDTRTARVLAERVLNVATPAEVRRCVREFLAGQN